MNNEPIVPAGTPTEPIPTEPAPIQPTPITGGSAAPVTDPIAFTPDPVAYPAEKKSKTALIIGAIIGVLVIAAAAFGILWYANYTKPETVALDAVSKFIATKVAKVDGTTTISLPENAYGLETIQMAFNGDDALIPHSMAGTITFNTSADQFSIGINEVMVSNGTIYFQAEGIVELLDAAIPEDLAPFVALFEAELDEFDGQWYELDVIEMVAMMGVTIADEDYTCAIDAIKSINSDSSIASFTDGYKQNPFVELEKTDKEENGAIGYNVSLNTNRLASFVDHMANNTNVLDPAERCFGPIEIEAADVVDFVDYYVADDKSAQEVTLYITDWGHELRAIKTSYQSTFFSMSSTTNISYPEDITVATPENTKPFSTFLESFLTKFFDILSEQQAAQAE